MAEKDLVGFLAQCLGHFSDKPSVPILLEHLTWGHRLLWEGSFSGFSFDYPVAAGLCEMGPSIMPQLLDAMSDENKDYQHVALLVIGYVGYPAMQELIQEYIANSTAATRRELIAKCLVQGFGKNAAAHYISDLKRLDSPLCGAELDDLEARIK